MRGDLRVLLCTLALTALAALCPTAARAQIPLPIPVPEPKPDRRWTKVRQLKQLHSRETALKVQLSAIRELSNWASTNSREMWNLYNHSRVNLEQARAAILKAQGKPVTRFVPPKGFEIAPVIAAHTPADYYRLQRKSSTVPVVRPDGFRLYARVNFPAKWVAERKVLQVSFQIYSENYLPMATRYQNLTRAVYRVTSKSQTVTRRESTFNAAISGLALLPGRYFVSCVVATKSYPVIYLVSLGMFRVEGELPSGVRVLLPHYRKWYQTHNPVVTWNQLRATVQRGAIKISGSYTRKDFKRGQKRVYIEALAVSGRRTTVVLRRYQKLSRARMTFGGRYFSVQDHRLPAGRYTLYVNLYTESQAGRRYLYTRGTRAIRSVQLTIP